MYTSMTTPQFTIDVIRYQWTSTNALLKQHSFSIQTNVFLVVYVSPPPKMLLQGADSLGSFVEHLCDQIT